MSRAPRPTSWFALSMACCMRWLPSPHAPARSLITRQAEGNLPLTIAFMRFASARASRSASVVLGPATLAPRLTKKGGSSSKRMSAGSSPITRAQVEGPGTSFDRSQRCSQPSARNNVTHKYSEESVSRPLKAATRILRSSTATPTRWKRSCAPPPHVRGARQQAGCVFSPRPSPALGERLLDRSVPSTGRTPAVEGRPCPR